jgi:hypothetical protein
MDAIFAIVPMAAGTHWHAALPLLPIVHADGSRHAGPSSGGRRVTWVG